MEKNIIVAELVQSNQSNNQVWFVHVTGCDNPELQGFCKQALAAIRFAFTLKRRSGFYISRYTLQRLMQLHKVSKLPVEETTTPELAVQEEEKPKRRTRRAKKEKVAQ